MKRNTLIIVATAILIITLPLLLGDGEGDDAGKFAGSDDQATAAISQLAPGYQPWATPLWEPPSTEIESLLFALQAAIGAGVLGFCLGRRRSRRQRSDSPAAVSGADHG